MRNLDILTKFSNTITEAASDIEYACLDEFGQMLFVYTKA
jgi:hypothetical protein